MSKNEKKDDQLTTAETKDVERHKYYMSLACGHDVGFAAAKADWLTHHADCYRLRKHEHMLTLQREEIARYKWIKSELAKRDLGREAALEWVLNYAPGWRAWYESVYGPVCS